MVTRPGRRCWPTGATSRGSGSPSPSSGCTYPKANGKQRPLGIPVIVDRVRKPRSSMRWSPSGRRGSSRSRMASGRAAAATTRSRRSHTVHGPRPQPRWVLDADLAAAFDRIDHSHLLAALGGFPARGLIERWLKAGVVDNGRFAPTEEGTPQGGVISPVLLNVALHGMEQAAGVRYHGSRLAWPARRWRAAPWWCATQTIWWRCASAVNRPRRSKRGWLHGWRRGDWPSTRTRHASSTSTTGSTSWGSTSAATGASC